MYIKGTVYCVLVSLASSHICLPVKASVQKAEVTSSANSYRIYPRQNKKNLQQINTTTLPPIPVNDSYLTEGKRTQNNLAIKQEHRVHSSLKQTCSMNIHKTGILFSQLPSHSIG